MVANGSEPREILLDPMIAGSRGADGCEFDREVDRECSPRVDNLVVMGSVDEPARNSAAIADATGAASTFRFGEQNPFRKMVATMTAIAKAETTVATEAGTGGVRGRMTEPPPSVMAVGEMLRMGVGGRSSSCDRGGGSSNSLWLSLFVRVG